MTLLNAAVTAADGPVRLDRAEDSSWGTRVSGSAGGPEVPGLSLETILAQEAIEQVDLLKVDIEGLEHEALATSPALARAALVVGELHPELLLRARGHGRGGHAPLRPLRPRRAARPHLRARPRPEPWDRHLQAGGVGTGRSRAPTLRGMDLAQHAAVLWRFRAILAGGLVLGIVLAVLAAYQLPVLLAARVRDLDQRVLAADHPVRRPRVPDARRRRPPAAWPRAAPDGADLEFADPNRLSALASLYAQLATGDRVRSQLPEKPKPAQIDAIALEGNASTQLPVIKLTTQAGQRRGRAAPQRAHRAGAPEGRRGPSSRGTPSPPASGSGSTRSTRPPRRC